MRRTLLVALTAGLVFVSGTAQAVGAPDPGFGSAGVVVTDLLDQTGPVDVDSAGRSVVLGVKSDAIAIARYLPDGTPDTSFSGDGRADVAVPVATARLADVRVLADGSIVAMGYRTTDPMNPFSNGLWSAKVTSSGAPSGGYGTNGVSIYDQGFTVFGPLGSIASDGSATIVQGGIGGGFGTMISPTGTFGDVVLDYDLSALPPGCGFQAPPSPRAAVRVSTSEFIHAIQLGAPIPACGLDIDDTVVAVTRQDDSGTIVWTKVLDAGEAISDEIFQNPIALVGSDVVLATEDGATNYVHRLSATTGAPVSSWGTGGRATIAAGFGDIGGIAELAGGKVGIVNAATFTSPPTSVMVERLTSTGAPDASFGRVTVPVGGELTSTAIAGAPDGGIHVTTQRDGQGALRRFIDDGGMGSGSDVVTVVPGRVLDTRTTGSTVDGTFVGAGKLRAGEIIKVKVAGRAGVATDAVGIEVNITAIQNEGRGFATLYPCTPDVPTASTLNYTPGINIANATTVALNTNGEVCIYTNTTAHYALDVLAYVAA